MILDKIENAQTYKSLGGNFARAFNVITSTDFSKLPDGRHDVDGDDLFFIVNRYQTKPLEECRLETHKKYADIQYMISGEEIFGYCPLSEKLECVQEYDKETDLEFFAQTPNDLHINFGSGMFIIAFPEDAHMPCAELRGIKDIFKIVFKVQIDG